MKQKELLIVLVVILGLIGLTSCSRQMSYRLRTGDFRLREVDNTRTMNSRLLYLSCDFDEEMVKPTEVELSFTFPNHIDGARVIPACESEGYLEGLRYHFKRGIGDRDAMLSVNVSFSSLLPFDQWERGMIEIEIFGPQGDDFEMGVLATSKVYYDIPPG